MNGDWVCTRCKTENEAWRGWCQRCTHPRGEDAAPVGAPSPAAARPANGPPRAIIVVVAVGLLAAALGFALTRGGDSTTAIASSSSSTPDSTTTTIGTRTAAQVAADEATAHGVVVQSADLGPLWTSAPSDVPIDATPFKLSSDPEFVACMGLATRANTVDTPTDVASDELSDGQRTVDGEVTLYANERAAKDDYALLADPKLATCIGQFLDSAVAEEINSGALPSVVKTGNAVMSDLHIGNVKTDAVALRALIPLQALQTSGRVQWDLVFARKGRTITLVSFLTNSEAFPVEFELAVVNTVVDRMPVS